jgi:hypothetical protein
MSSQSSQGTSARYHTWGAIERQHGAIKVKGKLIAKDQDSHCISHVSQYYNHKTKVGITLGSMGSLHAVEHIEKVTGRAMRLRHEGKYSAVD